MKKTALLLSLLLLLTTTACTTPTSISSTESSTSSEPSSSTPSESPVSGSSTVESVEPTEEGGALQLPLLPYSDVRKSFWDSELASFQETDYNPDDILTFTFNEGTVFEGNEALQEKIMEDGKNPGLGVRGLHGKGITGKGVNVAIIDQNLQQNHPEFVDKIVEYYDSGTETGPFEGSMHGPAVASLLVGETIGVAPDAKLYYAAAPAWNGDSHFYADSLLWIIQQNKALPAGEKIRVVSVSAAPSGEGSPFTENLAQWDEAVALAQADGILVLDCRIDSPTGIIASAYYDPTSPEDVTLCKTGYPSSPSVPTPASYLNVPSSYRTVAEGYEYDYPSYQYTGEGGLSWAIPYAAGVLALGWQINPSLTSDEIVAMLFETSFVDNAGSQFINPPAFIEAVEQSVA